MNIFDHSKIQRSVRFFERLFNNLLFSFILGGTVTQYSSWAGDDILTSLVLGYYCFECFWIYISLSILEKCHKEKIILKNKKLFFMIFYGFQLLHYYHDYLEIFRLVFFGFLVIFRTCGNIIGKYCL